MKAIERVVVLAHGWGYNHRFFNPLVSALQAHTPRVFEHSLVVALESGYFPDQAKPGIMIHSPQGWEHHSADTLHSLVLAHADAPWLGIGHSLGVVRLLNTSVRWCTMVSLHGFAQLAAMQPGQPGVAPRVLARMLSKAKTNLPQVLGDFHRACSHTPEWTTLNAPALLADLQWMQEANLEAELGNVLNTPAKTSSQVLALYSPHDAIVPAALAQNCFVQGPRCTLLAVDAAHGELGHSAARYTDLLLPVLRNP